MTPKAAEILRLIQNDCLQRGMGYHISAGFTVNSGGVESSGFFDDANKYLALGIDRPEDEWLSTLLHEHSHMEQFLEGSTHWANLTILVKENLFNRLRYNTEYKPVDAVTATFNYIEGKKIKGVDIDDATTRVVRLELDAEIRTIQKIIKYGLEDLIDPELYAQKALAYVLFYYTAIDRKQWYEPETAPYRNEAIYSQMPKVLMDPYNVDRAFVESLNVDFSSAFPKR